MTILCTEDKERLFTDCYWVLQNNTIHCTLYHTCQTMELLNTGQMFDSLLKYLTTIYKIFTISTAWFLVTDPNFWAAYFLQGLIKRSFTLEFHGNLISFDHLWCMNSHASHWEHLTEGQIADHKLRLNWFPRRQGWDFKEEAPSLSFLSINPWAASPRLTLY